MHPVSSRSFFPAAMDSAVAFGAAGKEIGLGSFSGLTKSGENVVMKYARSESSWSERLGQAGIDVYGMPRRMMLTRSWCVGSDPVGVERTLNLPDVKLRGFGRRCEAAYPSPSPF